MEWQGLHVSAEGTHLVRGSEFLVLTGAALCFFPLHLHMQQALSFMLHICCSLVVQAETLQTELDME